MLKKLFENKIKYISLIILFLALINLKNKSYYDFEILKNSFNKKWIPIYSIYRPEVLESKELLSKNNITRFNLFGTLLDEEYFHFRTVTYNYPVTYDQKESITLSLKTEPNFSNCDVLDEGKYLILSKC